MNIDEVKVRTLETKEQSDWFNNYKHEMNRDGILTGLVMKYEGFLSVHYGWELIEADGKIWPVKPDDNFKEIFGLNPVKSRTTHQHLPQEEVEANNLSFAFTNMGGGIPSSETENLNYIRGQLLDDKVEGEGSNKVQEQDIQMDLFTDTEYREYRDAEYREYREYRDGIAEYREYCDAEYRERAAMKLAAKSISGSTVMGGRIPPISSIRKAYNACFEVRCLEDEGERFNNMSVEEKQRYICKLPKPYDEVGDGGVFYIGGTSGSSTGNMTYGRGETSGSSTENMNYGHGEVRGHPDQNHIRKNHFASDDEGNRFGEAAMKQNIDNKKVNDEHVVDMPKGADHSDKKEQANDGLFRLCEIGLANTVSLMGSNPPPWAATPASQKLLGFSGAANAVGYVGTTAALSLRYTKPGAARIFANIGPISCAWGVIMGFTSYLPGEFQWLGYVAAVFCTLAVLFSNY